MTEAEVLLGMLSLKILRFSEFRLNDKLHVIQSFGQRS